MVFDQRNLEPKTKGSVRGSYFVFAFLTAVGVTVYYAIYKPLYLQPEKYKRIQKEVRKNMEQKKIQPGDMRVWSDPFKPLPEEGK